MNEFQQLETSDNETNHNAKYDIIKLNENNEDQDDQESKGIETDVKKKNKKNKSSFIKQVAYPTQYMKVGEVKCFFFSFFNQGRSPLLTIGPSWPFMLGLLTFAFLASGYFLFMLSMLTKTSGFIKSIAYGLIVLNNLLLFTGMLKNPGIPQTLFDKYLKAQIGKGADSSVQEDIESSGVDQNRNKKNNRSDINGPYHCSDCDIWRDEQTVHCEDCQVCILNYDHHCIFFGKCIGGGNVIPFYATLGMVVVVFCFFAFMTILDIVYFGSPINKS